MKKDSALNILITYARIPIYNTLITKDSITIIDKREKCVLIESLEYFRKRFKVDVAYHNAEELFFGAPINFNSNKKYYKIDDPYNYIICSHKPSEIRKNIRKDKREIISYYTLSDDLKYLKEQRILSPLDTTSVTIYYKERSIIDGYLLPKKVEVFIYSSTDTMEMKMEYKKRRINSLEPIHYVIPEKYDTCE